MRILVGPKDFLDGRYRFKAGERYEVPDRKSYFVNNGWATELADDDPEPYIKVELTEMSVAAAPLPAADGVTLGVDSVTHGVNAAMGGA